LKNIRALERDIQKARRMRKVKKINAREGEGEILSVSTRSRDIDKKRIQYKKRNYIEKVDTTGHIGRRMESRRTNFQKKI
jgi:hypothetical protein